MFTPSRSGLEAISSTPQPPRDRHPVASWTWFERINAYSQAVIGTLQVDEHQLLPDGVTGLEGRPGVSILDAAPRR